MQILRLQEVFGEESLYSVKLQSIIALMMLEELQLVRELLKVLML